MDWFLNLAAFLGCMNHARALGPDCIAGLIITHGSGQSLLMVLSCPSPFLSLSQTTAPKPQEF